jgi:hypothetical protein
MDMSRQRHAPAALYPRGKNPCTQRIGDCVGPRTGLDREVRRKISCRRRGLNLDRPVVQSVSRRYT